MKDENSRRSGDWVSKNYELYKPGFTRINLSFLLEEDQITLILNAIKFVSEHGWKLLQFYSFNISTGEFKHKNSKVFKNFKSNLMFYFILPHIIIPL